MPGIKGIHGKHPNTQKNLLGNKPGNRTGIRAKRLQIRDALFSGHNIAERLESGEWLEPLDLLMGWANDTKLAIPVRLEAAKTAAQYLHRKAPMQVAVSSAGKRPLADVPTEELLAALAKLTGNSDSAGNSASVN